MAQIDLTFYPHLASGAIWHGIPAQATSTLPAWQWSPALKLVMDGDLDVLNQLLGNNWERLTGPDGAEHWQSDQGPHAINSARYLRLVSQLADVRLLKMPGQSDHELWARTEDIRRADTLPVTLAFAQTGLTEDAMLQATVAVNESGLTTLAIAEVLPPPQFGEIALIDDTANGAPIWRLYTLKMLNDAGRDLQRDLAAALSALATPGEWWPLTPALMQCSNPGYRPARAALQGRLLSSRGAAREAIRAQLDALELAYERYQTMRQVRRRLPREAWIAQWEGIRAMTHQLAAAYWEAFQTASHAATARAAALPALTSKRQTRVPSGGSQRAIVQSFGPGVQPSLWNLDSGTIELQTPGKALVRLDAEDTYEQAALRRYVTEALGPEGLKHMLGILDAYDVQTNGKGQKEDARVSLRQLVMRTKGENLADDTNEHRKMMQTILYLARSFVTVNEKQYHDEPRRPLGRQRRGRIRQKEYSPLLVIERIQFEEDGTIRIPSEVVFHLGADHYELLYGEHKRFFTIPTAQLLSYHSDRDQHELMLGVYLCDRIPLNKDGFPVHFHTMLVQSALRTEDGLAHGNDRTRDALRALYALERLEQDGIHCREAHREVDTALAADFALGNSTERDLAPATLERIREMQLATADPALLREQRRKSLQRLLQPENVTAPLTFRAGPLIRAQAAKREAQRKAAELRDENAQVARVIQRAIPQVVDAVQQGGNADQKRRGRPRKEDR